MSAPTTQDPSARWAGRVGFELVRSPRAGRVLARLIACVGIFGALALAFAPWQQSASGNGRVVAFAPLERQQNVEAPLEGRVMVWAVREGSRVKRGDLVAEITDNDALVLERIAQERRAVAARVEAIRSRAGSIESRVASLTGSRRSATGAAVSRVQMAGERTLSAVQALQAAEAARETARLNQERQKALASQGLTATRAVELADLELVRTTTEIDRARATLAAARNEELALKQDLDRVGTDGLAAIDDARASLASAEAEEASAEAELARLDGRLARQQTQRVTAPLDGTVLRLSGGLGGEFVKAGEALAVLVPDTEARAVELWLDGNDIPLVSEGREVRLQFEGWPAVQFVGWPSVAVGTFGGRVVLVDATDNGRGQFRILVRPMGSDPWPSGLYLRQGVRANGWVLLNRVKLGYELWRRFNGFPPMLSQSEPGALNTKPEPK